jgi:hypothetical protein
MINHFWNHLKVINHLVCSHLSHGLNLYSLLSSNNKIIKCLVIKTNKRFSHLSLISKAKIYNNIMLTIKINFNKNTLDKYNNNYFKIWIVHHLNQVIKIKIEHLVKVWVVQIHKHHHIQIRYLYYIQDIKIFKTKKKRRTFYFKMLLC